MLAPTAAAVQEWTELADLQAAEDVKVARLVARANAAFLRFTGLSFDSVPDVMVPLVEQAVQGLTELGWYQSSEENLETLSDFDLIQNFSAGPYSETRRNPADAIKARLLVAWPWLSSLLWDLMTPEARARYDEMYAETPAPAFSVTEMDWGGPSVDGWDLPRSSYWGY